AHRRHSHLAQLEGEGIDYVLLLRRRLAVEEQPRLVVMLGELLRLAGQLHPGHRLGEGDKACLAGLERATAGQGVGLVGYLASVDGLTMQAVALVVVDRYHRRVDRDFMEVRPTQA